MSSAPPSYTLHVPPGNFRAFKILIAAEYCGVDIVATTAAAFDPDAVKSLSPSGRAPALSCPDGTVLFDSGSIAKFVGKIRCDAGLMGRSLGESAAVDAWVDFVANELEVPCSVLVYPVIGSAPFHKAAHDAATEDLKSALKVLDEALSDGRAYLMGDGVTLADVAAASALIYPFKLICDGKFRGG
eukprot:CAMPEP_0183291092 /NCGR_PEP_ID=MMETSP0160_2-20130417/634_1 /TAXON_ID=2839 ORGANISM="Odontella Sinensis, Strain Grunow 1884" /NCGR_SAMPLE_ID=MMETSP0160_2 /ASSEMBLY_ACC=CAM_ASM_000250 /LENGTH=185 /DNA_ID=CAMNT_0025451847 /DNA_START=62 /DNA_END=615 /DNA_ORIENTATION=-